MHDVIFVVLKANNLLKRKLIRRK